MESGTQALTPCKSFLKYQKIIAVPRQGFSRIPKNNLLRTNLDTVYNVREIKSKYE